MDTPWQRQENVTFQLLNLMDRVSISTQDLELHGREGCRFMNLDDNVQTNRDDELEQVLLLCLHNIAIGQGHAFFDDIFLQFASRDDIVTPGDHLLSPGSLLAWADMPTFLET